MNEIDDVLGMPKLEDLIKMHKEEQEQNETSKEQTEETKSALQKIKDSYSIIEDAADMPELEDHAEKMDEVYDQAFQWSRDLMSSAFNTDAKNQGEIAASAVSALNLALNAADSKAQKKLSTLKLRLEQERLKKHLRQEAEKSGIIEGEGVEIPTSELIKTLSKQRQSNK